LNRLRSRSDRQAGLLPSVADIRRRVKQVTARHSVEGGAAVRPAVGSGAGIREEWCRGRSRIIGMKRENSAIIGGVYREGSPHIGPQLEAVPRKFFVAPNG